MIIAMLTTRLEAIVFTEIAGYSRLMEGDEERTIELLKIHNSIVFPVIEAQSGEVINAIGDGLLVLFSSVRKAVECAVAIHEQIAAHNEAAPESERFKLRIGIHIGEVQHEGDRVYGTGVNVAVRVQPFALPGGICVTEDVFRQIERRIPNEMASIGPQKLRNISRQYELFRVTTGLEDANQEGDELSPADAATDSAPGTAVQAERSGELDDIKERILTEIGKWSNKHSVHGDAASDRSAQAGSKVFGVVERIMDRAITEWDKMPEEKRSSIIRKIKDGIAESSEKKEEKKKSDLGGQIVWGATVTAGMGIWFAQTGSVWTIVVGTLIGVLPLISGVGKLIKRSTRKRKEPQTEPVELEGILLRAAKQLGGRVTVVQIAAHVGRSLDEVERALDAMTSRGYVLQEVLDTGIIRYDFPSLYPDESDSKPVI
ncbi:MAG TPA: adenylate/guanylate cyclase domain-containing protein [Spirochaetia bacterium]|nr:adenylate/guanylate cyclase domain-containing protein [Spirochaetia bacterium]